jgi:cysteine desulfurase
MEGRKAMQVVKNAKDVIESFFKSKNSFKCIFHSGSTEGMNNFIQGAKLNSKKKNHYIFSSIDHAVAKDLHSVFDFFYELPVKMDLEFPMAELKDYFAKLNSEDDLVILNFTWVNNELGNIWDLKLLKQIKKSFPSILIHVDATQSIAKLEDFQNLSLEADCYSYSGHKFGALKGIGWSFIKLTVLGKISPLMKGGGQQSGFRPSTLNIHGIYSLQKSLEEVQESWDSSKLKKNIEVIRCELQKEIADHGHILSSNNMNLNTVFIYFENIATQLIMPALEMEGIIASSGSACSSGSILENEILVKLGLEKYAKNALRVSFSPFIDELQVAEFLTGFKKIFQRVR